VQKSVKNLNAWDARVVTPHLMRNIWPALANTISALKSAPSFDVIGDVKGLFRNQPGKKLQLQCIESAVTEVTGSGMQSASSAFQ
jgi:hypothetical protein